MFTVSTAAANTNLTTYAAVKLELRLADDDDKQWLESQIPVASMTVCNYIGIEAAENGTRTLGRETLVETIDRRGCWPWTSGFVRLRSADTLQGRLILGRRPVVSITSITEDGIAVDAADFQLSARTGVLKRLSGGIPIAWPATLIIVTYVAGWLLPDDADYADGAAYCLPQDIQDEAIGAVKAAWFAKERDPAVKSETTDNIDSTVYFFGTPGQGGSRPDGLSAKLDVYRNIGL